MYVIDIKTIGEKLQTPEVGVFSNIFRFIKLPQAMALDLGLYSEARRLSSYPQFANCGVRAVTGQ